MVDDLPFDAASSDVCKSQGFASTKLGNYVFIVWLLIRLLVVGYPYVFILFVTFFSNGKDLLLALFDFENIIFS